MSRRAMLVGLFSSGFLAKMLVGAVAVAAVGGMAATIPHEIPDAPSGASATTQTLLQTEALPAVSAVGDAPSSEALVERAREYAREVQAWGECVSAAVRAHSGEADPLEACGETPTAADHGLGEVLPTDLAKAEDKAVTTLDKATEKVATTLDKATEKAATTLDKATEKAATTLDKATEKAATTLDKATEKTATTLDRAEDKAAKGADKATEKAPKVEASGDQSE